MSKNHLPGGIKVRWLGHSTFDLVGPAGQKIILDPFIVENPSFPKNLGAHVIARGAYDLMLVTHPHYDHFADAVPMLKDDPALKVVTQFDIGEWMKSHGVKEAQIVGMNTGGTTTFEGIRITMVNAVHTSSVLDKGTQRALGAPVGYVLRFDNGFSIYITGDTAVTMDMKIVYDLYKPDLVILPIGDFFTMGPEQAAYALNLLKPAYAIGCHYDTWEGMPPGRPEQVEKELAHYGIHTQLIKLKPGETLT
jgi:L-ascorbate metabolism protein UlaG (beta-lactamase superfamily)